MFRRSVSKEILVCGYAAAARLEGCVLPKLAGSVVVREAHTKACLLRELRRGRQRLCVLEHLVPLQDPLIPYRAMFGKHARLAAQRGVSLWTEAIPALDLMPELVAASRDTRFVVACHMRGQGFSKEEREAYARHPEVLKLIGFINSTANEEFLVGLLRRMYLDED